MTTTDDIRGRLALALDLPDVDRAEQLAKELAPWFGVAKVGLELYSAAGPEAMVAVGRLRQRSDPGVQDHRIGPAGDALSRARGRNEGRHHSRQ